MAGITGLRWALNPILGDAVVYVPNACAVLIASRLGGRGPGLMAIAFSLVAVKYLFVPEHYSFAFAGPDRVLGMAMFAVLLAAIWWMTSQLRELLVALTHSERRLRLFVENAPAPIALLDRDLRYLAVSRRWITDYRLNVEDLTGRSHYEVFPEIPEHWKEMYRECLAGKTFKCEADAFPRAGGVTDWLRWELHPWRDGRGTIGGLVIFSEVITERLRLEEHNRRTEFQYRALFENMAEGLAYCRMIYRDGRPWDYEHIAVNNAYVTLTGLRNVVGKLASEVVPGLRESNPALLELFGRVASSRAPEKTETYVAPLDLWFSTSVYSPEPGYFVAVFTTINERKKAEAALRELNSHLEARVRERTAELEAAIEELESFSYSVSHDLRAPLRGIDGWSLALIEDFGDRLDTLARTYLERVRHESQRMGALIDDLLQLSRVGRAGLRREHVDLTALAHSITGRLREAHPGRAIEFDITEDLTAEGDARLLEIALNNLLDNAVKFTVSRQPARIRFGRDPQGAFVVQDNGVGFDMTHASALFTPFKRLHKPSEFPGTGIGLATVQRVIRRHGGRIWAEAEPERGATFRFVLDGST